MKSSAELPPKWVAPCWVGLGGILGSLVRWSLSYLFDNSLSGTLAANLFGVGLASFFLVAMEHRGKNSLRHLLLPGFCGGLTTFSALAVESVDGSGGITYLALTVIFSLIVVAICVPIARRTMAIKS